jgi:hypothetical protein
LPDLAFPDQVLHGPRHIFDRHVWVDAVLVVQVDRLDPEPLERALGALTDPLRPTVHHLLTAIHPEPELRGDHDPVADGGEGLSHELLVREGAVHLGGIEERDAAFDGLTDERDHLRPIRCPTVGHAHAHAAEADRRDLQAVSKHPLLHRLVSFMPAGRGSPLTASVRSTSGRQLTLPTRTSAFTARRSSIAA